MSSLISVVIPAYNEERYLNETLIVLTTLFEKYEVDYELVIVDNGSTDTTVDISSKYTSKIILIPKSNVSIARNQGAEEALGDVIVFIDADVRITEEWMGALKKNIISIKEERVMTGARYVIREAPSIIERYWFGPLSQRLPSYINGGNIILSKKTFLQIGGFDESLETGEDYEFSMRALKNKVDVRLDSSFKAIHDGYPSTAKAFVMREMWHGKGDCCSLHHFYSSGVAIASLAFAVFHVILLVSILLYSAKCALWAGTALMLLPLMMSFKIFYKEKLNIILVNAFISYLYLLGRFLSLISVLDSRIRDR